MKALIILCCFMLTCCGTIISRIDEDVYKMANTVWEQKDCRAGLAKSMVEIRPASLEARASVDRLILMADQDSEEYKKCFYLGHWFNALEYAGKDVKSRVLPDILQLIR